MVHQVLVRYYILKADFFCARPGGTGWVLLHSSLGCLLDANAHRKSVQAIAYRNVGPSILGEKKQIRKDIKVEVRDTPLAESII